MNKILHDDGPLVKNCSCNIFTVIEKVMFFESLSSHYYTFLYSRVIFFFFAILWASSDENSRNRTHVRCYTRFRQM